MYVLWVYYIANNEIIVDFIAPLSLFLNPTETHTHVHTYTHYAHTTHSHILSLSISLPQNTHIRPRCLLHPLPDLIPALIDLDFITYLFHIRFIHNPPLVQPLHAVPESVEQVNQQTEKQPNGESYPGGRVQLSH